MPYPKQTAWEKWWPVLLGLAIVAVILTGDYLSGHPKP
jgi:hypothetical protein